MPKTATGKVQQLLVAQTMLGVKAQAAAETASVAPRASPSVTFASMGIIDEVTDEKTEVVEGKGVRRSLGQRLTKMLGVRQRLSL